MALDLVDYERKAHEAVQAFWGNREAAKQKQIDSGKADQGERAGVTGGKNMDGFMALIRDIVRANGLAHAQIYQSKGVLTLPGYFRPTKLWDLLVIHKGELIASVELKSQVGPSFGNNFMSCAGEIVQIGLFPAGCNARRKLRRVVIHTQAICNAAVRPPGAIQPDNFPRARHNNRTEEAIGTAHDFWTAYREGAFGKCPRPFVGWLMMVEDAPESRSPVKDTSPHFPVFEEFKGASYLKRYDLLCQKLVQEQLYTTATLMGKQTPRGSLGALWIPACAGMTAQRFLPDRFWQTLFSRSRDGLPRFAWRHLGQRRLNLQYRRWQQAPAGSCRILSKMRFPASPNTD